MANAVHLQLDAFAEHAAAVTGPPGSAADRDPHELRIAGKALRYTLEMAVESGHPLPAAVTRTFKRMQDALGAWHDMVVLAERALHATLDAGLAYHDPALHLAVADVARHGRPAVAAAPGRLRRPVGRSRGRAWPGRSASGCRSPSADRERIPIRPAQKVRPDPASSRPRPSRQPL